MRFPKERQLKDLNQHIVGKGGTRTEQAAGFLDACNWLNENRVDFGNGYLAGDVALLKFNLITKRQVRKVPAEKQP